jgi:hypothetical protein
LSWRDRLCDTLTLQDAGSIAFESTCSHRQLFDQFVAENVSGSINNLSEAIIQVNNDGLDRPIVGIPIVAAWLQLRNGCRACRMSSLRSHTDTVMTLFPLDAASAAETDAAIRASYDRPAKISQSANNNLPAFVTDYTYNLQE